MQKDLNPIINPRSFMLHELLFFGCDSQFASYPHSFVSYSHSCKILEPHVAARVWVHYDEVVFSSIGASRIKTVIRK